MARGHGDITPIVVFVLGPGLPPGNGSVEASGQVVDNTVLLALSTPVALAVLVYLAYALIVFRERDPTAVVDGAPIRGHSAIQFWWLIGTTTLVLFLAGYGSIRLLSYGAGGGQGPNPDRGSLRLRRKPLQVQVVAQQWEFTYRYPAYGGLETRTLELPTNTTVELHVTSLDVIHSFWAYQLGVKADATPGVDNIAYVTTKGPLSFNVRCAELCGVWHGYMFGGGSVVQPGQFTSWIASNSVSTRPRPSSSRRIRGPTTPPRQGEVDERDRRHVARPAPALATADRLQPADGRRARHRRLVHRARIGTAIHAHSIDYFSETGENDIAILLGYFFGVVGFLVGLGFANYPLSRIMGHPPTLAEKESEGHGL